MESDSSVRAELLRQPRDAYLIGVELHDGDTLIFDDLTDLSNNTPKGDMFDDDMELIADFDASSAKMMHAGRHTRCVYVVGHLKQS